MMIERFCIDGTNKADIVGASGDLRDVIGKFGAGLAVGLELSEGWRIPGRWV